MFILSSLSSFNLNLNLNHLVNVTFDSFNKQVMNGRNLQRSHGSSRQGGGRRSCGPRGTSDGLLPPKEPPQDETFGQTERMQTDNHTHSEGDSDSSLPSPMREQYLSSDLEASGEDSDPRPPPGKAAVWIVKRQGQKVKGFLVFCKV